MMMTASPSIKTYCNSSSSSSRSTMKSKVISRDMLLYTILLLSHILPSISFKFLTSRHGTSHTTTTASTSSSRSSSSSRRYGIHAPSSPLDSLLTLDIDSELLNRRIVPYHVTSPTDIFCNREVNMQQIEAVGFDMDYTLASYKVDFDLLAYDGAVDKLIHLQGYPSDILPVLQYEEGLCRRGCLIDKKKGNLLKLDQYRYVRIAQHGLTTFTREERKTKYREAFSMMETFNGPDFAYTDTPFSLVDATLYAQLVDLRDRVLLRTPVASTSSHTPPVGDIPHIAPSPKVDQYLDSLSTTQIQSLVTFFTSRSYYQLWLDMRKAIDRCHFDGAIKLKVAEDPARYIHYDPDLFPMLQGFKEAGKKVFLLTNSLWDYTQVVMNFLHKEHLGVKAADRSLHWTEYFDLIIVGGNKPSFLRDDLSLPLYRVNPFDGSLQNMESILTSTTDISKLVQERPYPSPDDDMSLSNKFFQGGNYRILHDLLGIRSGGSILYVGDHIYSDILRSKRNLGWRTCLIVPELSNEILIHRDLMTIRRELMSIRRQQYLMENDLDALYGQQSLLSLQKGQHLVKQALITRIQQVEEELTILREELRERFVEFDLNFHDRWGQLFKAGFQDSSISKQIQDFACIYTSKASNLGFVSPLRPFRPPRDKMPHDHLLEGLQ